MKKKEEADNLVLMKEELMDKITESQSKHDRISTENKFKTAQLRNFQKQMERRLEMNSRELVSEESNVDDLATKSEDMLFLLEATKNEHLNQLESYEVIARENDEVRQRVNVLKDELSRTKNRNNTAMSQLRKEMFEIRLVLASRDHVFVIIPLLTRHLLRLF